MRPKGDAPSSGSNGERPLRIVLVCHELSLTGAPRLALEIASRLHLNAQVRTVSYTGGPLVDRFRRLGHVTVLDSPSKWLGHREHVLLITLAKVLRRIRLLWAGWTVRRWHPEVVYANSAASMLLVSRLGLSDHPIVLHVHELAMGFWRLTATQRELVRRLPKAYVAVSTPVASQLIESQAVDRRRVTVIPPLVDVERVRLASGVAGLERAPISERPVVVGGAGNPHWTKGVELWLLMAREVSDRLGPKGARFRWIGTRENEAGAQLRAMVEKLGLQDVVDLVPETDQPHRELAILDVFALTSWEDSAPLVTIESMALGVPVVYFTGSGGAAELVGDGGVGIDTFSPGAMAAAIVGLALDPERTTSLGKAATLRVTQYNKPEDVVSRFWQTLRDAADAGVREGVGQ